ncbi:hypothetical protein [Pedobacter arcticus]|uniref:hypothetical protein n=1 Tax=Pedobacter arcticus TaxID=752140 RepID=UPI0002DB9D73|nr:hypothetical protein [Pedobacter arcticus]
MENKKETTGNEHFERNGESNLADNEARNLKYNEEENSYELDVEGDNPDYQHPDPYDTAADNGDDMDSDYDEANPYVGDEYEKDHSLKDDLDKLGMHPTEPDQLKMSIGDEINSHVPEDDRDDLDAEGYPKKD